MDHSIKDISIAIFYLQLNAMTFHLIGSDNFRPEFDICLFSGHTSKEDLSSEAQNMWCSYYQNVTLGSAF